MTEPGLGTRDSGRLGARAQAHGPPGRPGLVTAPAARMRGMPRSDSPQSDPRVPDAAPREPGCEGASPSGSSRVPSPGRRLSSPGLSKGFTLIELLVVLVIIGVLIGFAVLSVGEDGRERALEREARRLAVLLELASEEAVLQARELGLAVGERGYAFFLLEGSGWLVLDDEILRPREFPDDVRTALVVEGRPAAPAREGQPPQILLLSSREVTPFTLDLRLESGTRGYRLHAELNGRIRVEPLDT
jgi:general secretion pathway protein H